jgi:hypothetical protein
MGEKLFGRAPAGLLVASGTIILMVVGFDLSSIASIGSAVALTIFGLVTCAHLLVFRETGAQPLVLIAGLLAIVISLLTFIFTTLVDEPATMLALVGVLAVSIILDVGWSWMRHRGARTAHAT